MLHSTLLQSLQRSDEMNWRLPGFIPEATNEQNDRKLLFVSFSTSNYGGGVFVIKKKVKCTLKTKNCTWENKSHKEN